MRIYLSGPISNTPGYERAFFEAELYLEHLGGHTIINPVRLDKGDTDKPWGVYIGRDLEVIRDEGVEAIVVLPGWEKSDGSRIEVAFGKILGLKILDLNLKSVILDKPDGPIQWHRVGEHPSGPISRAMPLVHGDRQKSYGHPSQDFARTAGMWKSMFGWNVKPEHVPLAMICVKLSRLIQSPEHEDSATDVAGYIETYSMTINA